MDILYVCFLLQLADRLRYSEGQFSEAGVSGAEQEPDWLRLLRARHYSVQVIGYFIPFPFHTVFSSV